MKFAASTFSIMAVVAASGLSAQDSATRKADVSSSPATRMETYNVDEEVSPKTHTLFMGADIDLKLDSDLYRVHDVVGSDWVVRISGRDHEISSRAAPEHLKITPVLKLTEAKVTIVGFVKAQSYSFRNDPSVLLTKGMSQSAAMGADLLDAGRDAQARSETVSNHALGAMSWLASSDDQFSDNAMMTTAEFAFASLNTPGAIHRTGPLLENPAAPSTNTSTAGNYLLPNVTEAMLQGDPLHYMMVNPVSDLNRGLADTAARATVAQARNGNEPTGRLVTEGMDAMDVQFGIRSAKPLRNPYVVTMTRFRSPGSKPGIVQNMVYAKSLDPIDQHISRVHLVEEGFPFGFEVVDFQLHIYDRGVELATNVSADRVELTREEAFEYVKMEYLGTHPKDTLPPVAAMGHLPVELRSKLEAGKYAATYYVKVSRDGYGNEAYSDPSCRNEVGDIFLNGVIRSLRFKPAIEGGKAVDGIAAVNLSQLQF